MANELIQGGLQTGQRLAQNLSASPQALQLLSRLLQGVQGTIAPVAAMNPAVGGMPKIALDAAQSVLKKFYTAKAEEAVNTPGGIDALNGLIATAEASETGVGNQTQATAQTTQPEQPSFAAQQTTPINQALTGQVQQGQPGVLNQLGNFLFNPGGVNQQGVAQAPSLLGGLIQNRNPQDMLARQQAVNLTPDAQISLKKREAEEVPLGKAEREKAELDLSKAGALEQYKQDRLDQRERLKAELKGTDNQNLINTIGTAADLFDLREKIFLKGPIGGPVGAIGGAIGIGTRQRAEFESMANQFVFDIGEMLGQKGRAFTEKEQKLVREKVIQASLMAKGGDFEGRMEAIFKRINRAAGEDVISVQKIKELNRQMKSKQRARPASPDGLTIGKYRIVSVS
jgi:hypothetical protein